MFWQPKIGVEVINYSSWHIHLKLHKPNSRELWYLTGFYGNPKTHQRHESWLLMSKITQEKEFAQCVIGDFNEIVTQYEKIRGIRRPRKQMTDFKAVLEDNGLFDNGQNNQKFIQNNRHYGETFTKEGLDRA